MSKERLYIFDTTLRDGAQTQGVDFSVDDKEKIIDRHYYEENPIGCGIMFRIEQLIEIGLYNEEQLWHEERELMDRFLKKFIVSHIQFPLYRYRQHDKNMTKNDEMMEKFNSKRLKKD